MVIFCDWPSFGQEPLTRLTVCYFPCWFRGHDFGSHCNSSLTLRPFYFFLSDVVKQPNEPKYIFFNSLFLSVLIWCFIKCLNVFEFLNYLTFRWRTQRSEQNIYIEGQVSATIK